MPFDHLWSAHPQWAEIFSDVDSLMVSSLERLCRGGFLSDAAALTGLLLAKSLRLNHVALPLKTDELERLCKEQLWHVRNHDGEFIEAPSTPSVSEILQGVDDLINLGGDVVEVQPLSQPVSPEGSPLLVSDRDDSHLYLAYRRYAMAEEVVTRAFLESAREPRPLEGVTADDIILSLSHTTISADGQQAIRHAIERSVSVITGGPGRGKTTVIASLLLGLRLAAAKKERQYSVALCAPTAKAAVRMEEAIKAQLGFFGETWADLQQYVKVDDRSGSVHRLLGIRPDNTKSLRQLDHDLVIIDEVSMLDISLLAKMIEHAPNTHLVFVGDADQLASVNVGAALRDIVDGAEAASLSGVITKLTVNYRFRAEIDELANAINSGVPQNALAVIEKYPEVIRRTTDPKTLVDENLQWARALRDEAILVTVGSEESRSDLLRNLVQRAILCATHVGDGSVAWWRDTLSRQLDVDGTTPTRFQAGTPILITENEQSTVLRNDQRLSNGDVGVAVPSGAGMDVLFGPADNPRWRREGEIGHAQPAWAITIHKSQGSEYDTVVVSLPHASSRVLTKELLYTAVTRAKNHVVIVGSEKALTQAIGHKTFRSSGVVDRLVDRA